MKEDRHGVLVPTLDGVVLERLARSTIGIARLDEPSFQPEVTLVALRTSGVILGDFEANPRESGGTRRGISHSAASIGATPGRFERPSARSDGTPGNVSIAARLE